MTNVSPEDIDAILPQTQCGLCGHGGCMPYAKALAYDNAPINLCPPGGVKTLTVLGTLLQQDPQPYLADMEQKAKPPAVASIRENECIGCKKCIQVCPVDAILGTAKQMHTVISNECTGCELCIPACPVDCIDLQTLATENYQPEIARQRFQHREKRLALEKLEKEKPEDERTFLERKDYIAAALARAKQKSIG